MTEIIKKRSLTESETAEYLGVSRSTLRKARMTGVLPTRINMPPYLKFGRSVRYLMEDIEAWIAKHRIFNTSIKTN